MKKIKLTQTCNITTGKLDANAAEEDGIFPYFTCAPEPLRINTYAFDGDVILLAGNNASGNFHCQRYNGKFNAYQRTYVITAKEGYDLDYIYYNLLFNLQILRNHAQGSQTKFLTMQVLDAFEIDDVDIVKQKKISGMLSAIDSKIKNNNAIIEEIEKVTKTIFDYWFTQFDFPGEDGLPYKESGGELIFNEEINRTIPVGWNVSTIGEECNVLLGGTPDTSREDFWNGDIPWLNSGEVAVSPVVTSEKKITKIGMDNSATSFAEKGAVVMSITRYIRPSILGIDACFNQSVVAVVPTQKFHTSFIYPLMKGNVDNYMRLRTGAQQPHINKETVEATRFIVPPKSVIEKYYEKVDSLYSLQTNVSIENQELIELRDFVLPLLLNGQISL